MENDEARLVARAREGGSDAVAELFRRHWPSVWRAAYSVCGQRALADDVAQEAFVRGISSLGTFDERRPLRPWLTRIAVNAAIDELRRDSRLAPSENSAAPTSEVDWPHHDEIVRAVAQLTPDKRLIVALHYWLDYETREIAEMLELPLGTVASRLSRALSELRKDLEAEHV